MNAISTMPISFPGLFGSWEFNPDPIAVHIGHGIYWYGIILACAMLAGVCLAMKQAKHYGLTEDHIMDLALWAVPCCILGSRIYYVLFYLDLFRNADGTINWAKTIAIWDGGIAIYGTVIMGFLVVYLFTKFRKIPFGALADVGVMGLLLGQCIGRWANFINREAFGGVTNLPWGMQLYIEGMGPTTVHPTFFYESMWNLVGLLLVLFVVSKGRRFDGENACFYLIWYGLGRFWIEGMRTDSLYLFNLKLFGQPLRVSQCLSVLLVLLGAGIMLYQIRAKHRTSDGLYVNVLARQVEEAAEEAAECSAETEPNTEEDEEDGNAD